MARAEEDQPPETSIVAASATAPAQVARALYDHAGQNHDELSLAAGDLVTISSVQDHGQGDDWLHGSLPDGRAGIFPANYVRSHVQMGGNDTSSAVG